MNKTNTHKDLDVWKLGIDLVKEIYILTKKLPRNEQFGLVAQMRRCAISIPSNMAEGAARNSKKEYLQFLYISLGSMSELETLRRKMLNFIKYMKNDKDHRYSKIGSSNPIPWVEGNASTLLPFYPSTISINDND